MASKDFMADYVMVNERIVAFYERYPDGSLQGSYEIIEILDSPFLVYRAEAYRSPDDPRPGVGYAWEPIPGLTTFTKGSELMVGETSAWGRALAALGFEVKRSVASQEEVRNRAETPSEPASQAKNGKADRDLLQEVLRASKGWVASQPDGRKARAQLQAFANAEGIESESMDVEDAEKVLAWIKRNS